VNSADSIAASDFVACNSLVLIPTSEDNERFARSQSDVTKGQRVRIHGVDASSRPDDKSSRSTGITQSNECTIRNRKRGTI